MDPLMPPVSVVLALWAPVPSSQGAAVVQGPDTVHDVVDAVSGQRLSLERWLARARPLSRAAALLPSPADGLLTQPEALERGQAVLLETAAGAAQPAAQAAGPRRLLLVPHESVASTVWSCEAVDSPLPPLDPGQARRDVHTATEEAIDALVDLDLARERPDLADTLTDVITATLDPRLLPPSLDPRRARLLERSLRLCTICSLALEDDGAATTAWQAQERAQVLRPLLAVARRGVAAATDWWAP